MTGNSHWYLAVARLCLILEYESPSPLSALCPTHPLSDKGTYVGEL